MDKQEAKDLIKVLGMFEKTVSSHTKELTQFSRKIDTLNDNINRLNDKIGTYIQLLQNN
jgi:septal ring factor EnvC (AmiA/AmiB activator)